MKEPPPLPWCFVLLLTLFVINTQSDMVRINDPAEIGEFLFDCADEPWLTDCKEKHPRRFFMLFDEQGNYIEELNKRDDSNSSILVSRHQKARKPDGKQIMKSEGYPTFLFQLEKAETFSLVLSDTETFSASLFYIITRSGKLLAAENKTAPNLVLMADNYCTNETGKPELDVSQSNKCDQAKWTLWKIDEMFLSIESDFQKKFYLNVANQKVTLGDSKEKMTGEKTSFYTGPTFTLDRSADVDPEAGIGPEDYGDVVVHYKDRHGIYQTAYVCDYEWGLEDAHSICRQLNNSTGIPTFDGRFSRIKDPEYAVSGVQCEGEDFKNCEFRTRCGKVDPNCLVQQSMKQFEGKGYACNKGSKTDAAGVICGNQTTINNILQEKIKCNRDSIETDRDSVAQMNSMQNQIKRTGSKVFGNKHWSAYLLPMPMAISLMSTLLLVSSQFDKDVELIKPTSGQWDYLKYDLLQPNLLFLSNNIKNDFELSNLNMIMIKLNSERVHTNMKLAVAYAFSTNKYENKILLKRHLGFIEEEAAESKEKAEEVSDAFKDTQQIIQELLEALQNSDSVYGNEKVELEIVLKEIQEKNRNDTLDYEKEKKEKTKYDIKVKKSRKSFFDAINAAMNAQCVDGYIECELGCDFVPSKKTGECLTTESYCSDYEEYCTGENFWGNCDEWDSRCRTWSNRCVKYKWTVQNDYCLDQGKQSKICGTCDWIKDVQADMKSVGQVSMQLQTDSMRDGGSYAHIALVVEDLVGVTKKIHQGLEEYSKAKDSKERGQLQLSAGTDPEDTIKEKEKENENDMDKNEDKKKGKDKEKKVDKDTSQNRNIRSQLNVMKQQLSMQIELMKGIKQPIGTNIIRWAGQLELLLDGLINQKIQYYSEINEDEKIKVDTLYAAGSKLLQEAIKLRKTKEISLEGASITSGQIGDQATEYTENMIGRMKSGKKIESLANQMSKSLQEILHKTIKTQDLKATIEYLNSCLKHLTYLQTQWDTLTQFFGKLTIILTEMKKDIKNMKLNYEDLGHFSLDQPLSKTFREMLQTNIVDGLANNIYVMKIAYFYTKIAENGLLDKLSEIGLNLQKLDGPQIEKYKKFIEAEAMHVQEQIKSEVSKEEAKMNDQMIKEVSMMKNELACQLEDRRNLSPETIMTLEAMKNVEQLLSSENNEKNVKDTFETATEEDIEIMTLFDDAVSGIEDLEDKNTKQDMGKYLAFDEDDFW